GGLERGLPRLDPGRGCRLGDEHERCHERSDRDANSQLPASHCYLRFSLSVQLKLFRVLPPPVRCSVTLPCAVTTIVFLCRLRTLRLERWPTIWFSSAPISTGKCSPNGVQFLKGSVRSTAPPMRFKSL